ncbi:MAG: VOC family protein [Armatimonadota bacterium]
MQKITPCLWFDGQAEEAAGFYTSIFSNSQILRVARYGEEGAKVSGKPKGSVMTVEFVLDGQEFLALNGGPEFTFTPAISLSISCETQAEVDGFWEKLTEGGEPGQCGWLTDRFGVTWQVVPRILGEMLRDSDEARVEKVMRAMLQMTKMDIAALQQAYEQR